MAKIDRLGWAAGIGFVAYGVRIGIRVNKPEVLERLADLLPPEWKPLRSPYVDRLYSVRVGGAGPRPNVRRFHLLYAGSARLARTMDLDQVWERLEHDVQLYVAEAARRRVFVHAGVVGWRRKAIVIPGRSFSGKTTLVAALLRAGATYYSDEYAVIDARGRVHPYSKPLSLREDTGKRPRKCTAEALGSVCGVRPLPVGLVAVSQYKPGARWRPRRLSPGRAVLALFANTVPARRQPEVSLATLQQVVSRVPVLKGTRGEAEEVVDFLLQRLAG